MPLHVICSGCLKRFQVGTRFAGMQGPCPNCKTIIAIPKESLKIHGGSTGLGKGKEPKTSVQVIPRFDLECEPVLVLRCVLGVLGVLLLTCLLGWIPMYYVLRSLIAVLGLCLIAFPLTLFGYQTLRDQEQMFAFTGGELYRRVGMTATGYVVLWIILEYFLAAAKADIFVSWFYFAAVAGLAALLVIPILALKVWDALLHYCLFGFSVIVLRFFIGFGWFWQSSELVRHSSAPPPPFLPGM